MRAGQGAVDLSDHLHVVEESIEGIEVGEAHHVGGAASCSLRKIREASFRLRGRTKEAPGYIPAATHRHQVLLHKGSQHVLPDGGHDVAEVQGSDGATFILVF